MKVLVTGGSGAIGTALRAGLPAYGHDLVSLDRVAPAEVVGDEDVVVAELGTPAGAQALRGALDGVEAVAHFAGIPSETSLPAALESHVSATDAVLGAAQVAGVRRFVYASSNHAVGFTPRATIVGTDARPRPDSYYGVGKVAAEGVCSLYADRFGMACVALRIGSFLPRPLTRRHLSTWLSPDDAVRLVHAALTGSVQGFVAVYGISANTRAWWDLAEARALGYQPADDAEVFAADILSGPETDLDVAAAEVVGGEFAVRQTPLPREETR